MKKTTIEALIAHNHKVWIVYPTGAILQTTPVKCDDTHTWCVYRDAKVSSECVFHTKESALRYYNKQKCEEIWNGK